MVYVDELFSFPISATLGSQAQRVAKRYNGQWCHLSADTENELHVFAKRIGMKREWAQKEGTIRAHYDLTPIKREAALKAGAIFKSAKEQAIERITKLEASKSKKK